MDGRGSPCPETGDTASRQRKLDRKFRRSRAGSHGPTPSNIISTGCTSSAPHSPRTRSRRGSLSEEMQRNGIASPQAFARSHQGSSSSLLKKTKVHKPMPNHLPGQKPAGRALSLSNITNIDHSKDTTSSASLGLDVDPRVKFETVRGHLNDSIPPSPLSFSFSSSLGRDRKNSDPTPTDLSTRRNCARPGSLEGQYPLHKIDPSFAQQGISDTSTWSNSDSITSLESVSPSQASNFTSRSSNNDPNDPLWQYRAGNTSSCQSNMSTPTTPAPLGISASSSQLSRSPAFTFHGCASPYNHDARPSSASRIQTFTFPSDRKVHKPKPLCYDNGSSKISRQPQRSKSYTNRPSSSHLATSLTSSATTTPAPNAEKAASVTTRVHTSRNVVTTITSNFASEGMVAGDEQKTSQKLPPVDKNTLGSSIPDAQQLHQPGTTKAMAMAMHTSFLEHNAVSPDAARDADMSFSLCKRPTGPRGRRHSLGSSICSETSFISRRSDLEASFVSSGVGSSRASSFSNRLKELGDAPTTRFQDGESDHDHHEATIIMEDDDDDDTNSMPGNVFDGQDETREKTASSMASMTSVVSFGLSSSHNLLGRHTRQSSFESVATLSSALHECEEGDTQELFDDSEDEFGAANGNVNDINDEDNDDDDVTCLTQRFHSAIDDAADGGDGDGDEDKNGSVFGADDNANDGFDFPPSQMDSFTSSQESTEPLNDLSAIENSNLSCVFRESDAMLHFSPASGEQRQPTLMSPLEDKENSIMGAMRRSFSSRVLMRRSTFARNVFGEEGANRRRSFTLNPSSSSSLSSLPFSSSCQSSNTSSNTSTAASDRQSKFNPAAHSFLMRQSSAVFARNPGIAAFSSEKVRLERAATVCAEHPFQRRMKGKSSSQSSAVMTKYSPSRAVTRSTTSAEDETNNAAQAYLQRQQQSRFLNEETCLAYRTTLTKPDAQGLMPNAHNVRGDRRSPCALPTVADDPHKLNPNIRLITQETFLNLYSGRYSDKIDNFVVIDCRFPFEYEAGHIMGAKNFWTRDSILKNLFFEPCIANEDTSRVAIIFHCEFSAHRGPGQYIFTREVDLALTHNQDHLLYPEMYVLYKGYKEFYHTTNRRLCTPCCYLPMKDKSFVRRCEENENKLRESRYKADQLCWQNHDFTRMLHRRISEGGQQGWLEHLTEHQRSLEGAPPPGQVPQTPLSQVAMDDA